jgi:hypothetical protein
MSEEDVSVGRRPEVIKRDAIGSTKC